MHSLLGEPAQPQYIYVNINVNVKVNINVNVNVNDVLARFERTLTAPENRDHKPDLCCTTTLQEETLRRPERGATVKDQPWSSRT